MLHPTLPPICRDTWECHCVCYYAIYTLKLHTVCVAQLTLRPLYFIPQDMARPRPDALMTVRRLVAFWAPPCSAHLWWCSAAVQVTLSLCHSAHTILLLPHRHCGTHLFLRKRVRTPQDNLLTSVRMSLLVTVNILTVPNL